ncbi:hypothetical protein L218DRAFT_132823 [Marasmius fiardii PR-910]|nr:hypothetical protein L218DRAFT_132823 [Marasmius fiardii PR-910]
MLRSFNRATATSTTHLTRIQTHIPSLCVEQRQNYTIHPSTYSLISAKSPLGWPDERLIAPTHSDLASPVHPCHEIDPLET